MAQGPARVEQVGQTDGALAVSQLGCAGDALGVVEQAAGQPAQAVAGGEQGTACDRDAPRGERAQLGVLDACRFEVGFGARDVAFVFVPDEQRHADADAEAVGRGILEVALELEADRQVACLARVGQVALGFGRGHPARRRFHFGATVRRRFGERRVVGAGPGVGSDEAFGFRFGTDQVGEGLLGLHVFGFGLAYVSGGPGLIDLEAGQLDRRDVAGLLTQASGNGAPFIKGGCLAGDRLPVLGQVQCVVGGMQGGALLSRGCVELEAGGSQARLGAAQAQVALAAALDDLLDAQDAVHLLVLERAGAETLGWADRQGVQRDFRIRSLSGDADVGRGAGDRGLGQAQLAVSLDPQRLGLGQGQRALGDCQAGER